MTHWEAVPPPELGLDLVKPNLRARLPRWDPRLWGNTTFSKNTRQGDRLRTLGLQWARERVKARKQMEDALTLASDATSVSCFTGKEEDVEVGLTYFGKRFLSAALGRWVSPDPLAVHQPNEADLNLYAYVHGQVLKATDPIGLRGGDNPVKRPDGSSGSYDADDATEISPPTASITSTPARPGSSALARMSPQPAMTDEQLSRALDKVHDDALGQFKSIEEAFPHGLPGQIEVGDLKGYAKGLWNGAPSTVEGISRFVGGDLDLSSIKFDIGPKEQSGAFIGEWHGPGPLKITSTGLKIAGKAFQVASEIARVTSWADKGVVPDLKPGRWVQLGEATTWNFLKTGLIGPKAYLQSNFPYLRLQSSKAAIGNFITDDVPRLTLQWPKGWEKWKGILGQRQIKEP